MGGIRVSGAAPAAVAGLLPWSMYDSENTYSNVHIVAAGSPLRLTPDGYTFQDEACNPVLSPDGQHVAYRDFDPSANTAVYVVPADGSANAVASLDPDYAAYNDGAGYWIHSISWKPDGSSILFTSAKPEGSYTGGSLGGKIMEAPFPPENTATTLWLPDLQTPVQREEAWRPFYSPDMTKIAFFVNVLDGGGGDYTRQGLWVMDADGSNAMLLDNWTPATGGGGYRRAGTQLAWSNDSQWIAYTDSDYGGDGTRSAWVIRPDGTDKTLLMTAPNVFGCFIGWGAWAPDDEHVYVSAYTEVSPFQLSVFKITADGSSSTEIVGPSDGPDGSTTNPQSACAYRLRDRIYWIYEDDPAIIKSCDLDGNDLATYFDGTSVGGVFVSGQGIEVN